MPFFIGKVSVERSYNVVESVAWISDIGNPVPFLYGFRVFFEEKGLGLPRDQIFVTLPAVFVCPLESPYRTVNQTYSVVESLPGLPCAVLMRLIQGTE
jgi:hypothetical protein